MKLAYVAILVFICSLLGTADAFIDCKECVDCGEKVDRLCGHHCFLAGRFGEMPEDCKNCVFDIEEIEVCWMCKNIFTNC